MHGLHLTADLHQCRCEAHWLTDTKALLHECTELVKRAGLQPVAQLCHTFPATATGAGGVTATVLLAESHLCIHTWPEQLSVTLDVYVCNFGQDNSHKARTLMNELLSLFLPVNTQQNTLVRGDSTS